MILNGLFRTVRGQLGLACLLFMSLAGRSARGEDVPAYRTIPDVVYGHKDGLGLTLDVLVPEKNPKHLGIILVSSGSWKSSKSNVAEENVPPRNGPLGSRPVGGRLHAVRRAARQRPRDFVPEMIEDIRRSVRFVRHRARDYEVDPTHLGITSGSSGGHLALMVGLTGDDGKPDSPDPIERESSRTQAIVSWFPPTDMINWGTAGGYRTIEASPARLLSGNVRQGDRSRIAAQVRFADLPGHAGRSAALLLHGDKDKTVPLQQSEILKAKYEEVGLPVKLIVQPGGGHSWWPTIMQQYPVVWEWFDQYLK